MLSPLHHRLLTKLKGEAGGTLCAIMITGAAWISLGCESGVQEESEEAEPEAVAAELVETTENEVAATVNEQTITHGQVDQHLAQLDELFRHSQRSFDDTARQRKRQQVLQRLIDRELLRGYLAENEPEIDETEVEEMLEQRIADHFGGAPSFNRYLESRDLTVGDYRRRLREELALETLISAEIDSDQISAEKLRAHYERIASQRPAGPRVHATVASVDLSAADPSVRKQLLTDVNGLTAEDADDYFDGLQALVTRSAGEHAHLVLRSPQWLQQHQLRPQAAKLLFAATTDDVGAAPLMATDRGFKVYWLHERRAPGVRGFDEVEDLLRERAYRSELVKHREQLLQELREQASITVYDSAP